MGKLDGSEKVLCVSRFDIEKAAPWDGFLDADTRDGDDVEKITFYDGKFRPRTEELENNPLFLQVIGYASVWDDDPGYSGAKILLYRRTKMGAEGRLRGKLSIGFGGHTNQEDAERGARLAVRDAIRRELSEELGLPTDGPAADRWWIDACRGFIFDSTWTGVEAVHLGAAYDAVVLPDVFISSAKAEDAIVFVGWLTRDELRSLYSNTKDDFEKWSQVVIERSILKGEL